MEQDSPSKVPLLLPGDISPAIMCEYEYACLGYFDTKDIVPEKQVRKILAGLWDTHVQDWVSINRERLLALMFAAFMTEFKKLYLPKDWEEITRIKLLQMNQGNDIFWNFAIQVQTKNSILIDTPSYLDKDQLRNRIEAGMNSKLALRVRLDKVGNKDNTLAEWLDNIKCVDELMRAENANFESIVKATHKSTRRTNTLAEPSRHVNTNNNFVPNNATSSSASRSVLPKLSSVKRQLLYDNEGCLKCRRIFVQHRSAACPNDFPDTTNYKPLTQSFVDLIKKRLRKPLAAVMTSVAETEAVTASVAVPIAAVMGMSRNPTAYMPSNTSSVIEGESDSDMSVSNRNFAAAVANQATSALTALNEDLALFTVLHLFWRCSINGAANGFPITLSALIDHGSHVVLISDEFTNSLFLKHRKLFEPMSVELAMPAKGPKGIVCLSEWVKLKLYDPSGVWQSKTVRCRAEN